MAGQTEVDELYKPQYNGIEKRPIKFPTSVSFFPNENSGLQLQRAYTTRHASCPWAPATAHGMGILTELYDPITLQTTCLNHKKYGLVRCSLELIKLL